MGDRQKTIRAEEMATTSTAVTTVPPQTQETGVEPVAVITLRHTRAPSRKKVVWTEDTVDNENMNKKKSKCCCIYEKPRSFDESDSESSDDECEHCFGHVEHKWHKHHATTATPTTATTTTNTTTEQEEREPTTEVTLRPKEEPTPPTNPTPPDS
ncbi:uncharacterized protein [Battus philenor]|uniref:uncharacterized protein n=1 Tax=Battus philenor TaxID=42288 RepID=UPI0035D03DA8